MPRSPLPLSQPRLLIGEGTEDVRFCLALLKHLGINDVQVEPYGGKAGLRAYLHAVRLRPDFGRLRALAIIRDADTNATSAFHSVCDALRANTFAAPAAAGRWVDSAVRVGVWIMPDGHRAGMLEDLCLAAVQHDAAMVCVAEYFRCVFQSQPTPPSHLAKARIHAWLASRAEPDVRLGEAAEKGYWPWASVAFIPFRTFLQGIEEAQSASSG